ncbi:uncharacterized protein G2W53_010653 [Senna tora]|uniref:Uncharacterized protein n=1 Tax=Senna tora TaxID=362788 RepID=A0A834X0C2_9FABA|nr:uncharacterized protein G2W53_010653 [Senna tora]
MASARPCSNEINDLVADYLTASGTWDWNRFEYLLPDAI